MTQAILSPNGTKTNNGVTFNGATLHGTISDNSNTTYAMLAPGTAFTVNLSDLTLPAGAVIKQFIGVAVTTRFLNSGTGYFDVYAGSHYNRTVVNITWSSPTAHYVNVYSSPTISDADIDGAEYYLGTNDYIILYELDLIVVYVTQPVVNITAPAGTVTNNSSPDVTWTVTSQDTDGGSVTHFEVEILDSSSDVVLESGTVTETGATSWSFDEGLPEGNYTCRVRIGQTVNSQIHWSAWDSQTFTIDAQLPGNPTIDLTPDSANGRIRVDLDDPGGEVDASWFHLERSDDGGVTWEWVRNNGVIGLIAPTAGSATVYDYDAPNGVTVQYRVHASHWFNFGTPNFTTTTSGYTKASDSWVSTEWWLKHPTKPSLNWHPVLKSQPGRSNAATQGVFHPLGRSAPVVVSDVRQMWTGEVTIRCATDADREYLDAILADGYPVLLQGPADAYWEDTWLAVSSVDRQRAIDAEWGAYTFDTLSWVQVEAPALALEE